MKNRNRWNNRKGFTMAELLLVVAIIIVLAALAFVGITRYLRSLHQLEMDNAAKQVFYAAQNRITAELNSGTLGRLDTTGFETDTKNSTTTKPTGDSNIKMVIFPTGVSDLKKTLWDEMLPFGAIDETVRAGGSYIITYSLNLDANLATVLDVWYASDKSSGIARNWDGSENTLLGAEYSELVAAKDTATQNNKNKRLRFPGGTGPAVIGHYGRDDATALNELYNFHDLSFKLVNDEVLYGDFTFQADKIRPTNTELQTASILSELNPQIKLTITGVKSEAKLIKTYSDIYNLGENVQSGNVIRIKSESDSDKSVTYRFILDNITKEGERFRDLVTAKEGDGKSLTGTFVPGEDIRVNVEVYSNIKLSNIDSASAVDNSLFQYVKKTTDNVGTTTTEAGIGKIRHLQNLSSEVSGVNYSNENTRINKALQTGDLSWKVEDSSGSVIGGFVNFKPDGSTAIGDNIYYNETSNTTHSFYPIDVSTELVYEAGYKDDEGKDKRHTINNLVVSGAEHAGLFGTVRTPTGDPVPHGEKLLTVQNLEMNGANMTGTETAGAIIANEVNAASLSNIGISAAKVNATAGNAGGAVGKAANGLDLITVTVTGETSVTAASGNAGGLLGEMHGSVNEVHLTISDSAVGDKDSQSIAVASSGTGKAGGGLVGAITDGLPTITNSYSTALVSGDTAGGLVGSVVKCYTDSKIISCYVGGHTNGSAKYDTTNCNVKGQTYAGGFIGSVGTGASMMPIQSSYTTASVSAETAGGFVGEHAGGNISYCYAVGYVKDTTTADPNTTPSGAFVGNNLSSLTGIGNLYFELINGTMPAVGGAGTTTSFVIKAAETDLDTYNDFVQFGKPVNPGDPQEFYPYDTKLKTMFDTRYFLPTVSELSGDTNAPTTHVGDWQPVDTLVLNTPNS